MFAMAVDSVLGLDVKAIYDAARSDVIVNGAPIKHDVIALLADTTPSRLSHILAENRIPTPLFRKSLRSDPDGYLFVLAFVRHWLIAMGFDVELLAAKEMLRAAMLSAIDVIQQRVPVKAELGNSSKQEVA